MHEVIRTIFSSNGKAKFLDLINHIFLLQSDADYWLLSDADVSITDMWRTERMLYFLTFFFYLKKSRILILDAL